MTPVERLAHVDGIIVHCASVGTVASALTNIRILRGHLAAREAELARRQQVLAETEGAAPAIDALNRGGRTSRREAQKAAARAELLADAPCMSALLEKGRVTTDHADVLASEAAKLDDDQRTALLGSEQDIASAAAGLTPEQFRRDLLRTIRDQSIDDGIELSERQRGEARITLGTNPDSGMGEVRGQLHPDDFQRMNRRIDAEVRALRTQPDHDGLDRAQLSARALVNLVCGARATSRQPADVVIHVPLATLLDTPGSERFGEYSDGSPVPVETVRRHACDANVIPVVLDSEGMPLDVGRGRRLATRSQRHALRAMYRTCAVGDCSTSFDRCDVHHTLEWAQHRGPTDLEHLIPLCSYHHHRVHEGRWRLQLDPSTRALTVSFPDGSRHSVSMPDAFSERRRAAGSAA